MSYFTLNAENTRVFQEMLQKAQHDKSLELEIRFGSFDYNKDTKQTRFIHNCDIEFFYKLKQSFERQGFPVSTHHTREDLYEETNGGVLKKITPLHPVSTTNNETFIYKNSLKKYNVFDYDFRISLAKESISHPNLIISSQQCMLSRQKKRTTFVLPIGKLDLTIVEESNHVNLKYEVELELETYDIDLVMQFLTVILQTRQNNYYVISNNERRQIVAEYRELAKAHFFVGAQPETLQKTDINTLYKKKYSVTEKVDGERMFLLITRGKNVYFIDSNINKVYKTNMHATECSSVLMDGELVTNESTGQVHFLAFDILVTNNFDIRGNDQYLLPKRLALMQDVIKDVLSHDTLYKIKAKKYIFTNVFLGSEQILNNATEYKNDGVIFTPIEEPYPTARRWPSLLKWKPAEQNTIDFYSVQQPDGKTWALYVQHVANDNENVASKKNNSRQRQPASKVLFDVATLCDPRVPSVNDKVTSQTTFDSSLIDPTTNEPFKSGTVIEFKWDKMLDKFVPLRTRWDKTSNPRKHGNFSAVACDIWNNIHNPIDKELLFKFTTFSTSKEDAYFERMRRFHNKVKEMLYNKYTYHCKDLLELCSGKGGDMHKWLYNNVQNVVGYDISEKNIAECKRRLETSNHPNQSKMTTTFHHLDLCSQDADKCVFANNPSGFDVICCHFGAHYFFKSQNAFKNLVKILEGSLHDSGYFIMTCMDNVQLENLFTKHNQTRVISKEINNELVYYIKRQKEEDSRLVLYGNSLRIVLNGNNILGEGSDEYIINFENFVQDMKNHDMEIVETKLFSEITSLKLHHNLTQEEQDISFLNRYIVFQKRARQEFASIRIDTPPQDIQEKQVLDAQEFDINDLHIYNLGVYKITTKYDIIDALNCITYKYYKNQFTNQNIDSFEDIENVFSTYGITSYSPHFVVDPFNKECYRDVEVPIPIHFTFHKHTIEKSPDTDLTCTSVLPIEYKNWYILLHNKQICFAQSDLHNTISNPKNTSDNLTPNHTNEDTQNNKRKQDILQTLESNKVTLKILKEILSSLNMKTSGKKEELLDRVKSYCQKNE